MEQQMQYLMWLKSKQIILKSKSSSSSSWEEEKEKEEAFANDVCSPLGGGLFTWPPRSYSCSFCARLFKSAQALGGHMNVHRRDRALLIKQYSHDQTTQHIQSPPPPNSPVTTTADSSGFLSTTTTLPISQNPISPKGSDHFGLSNQDSTHELRNKDMMVDTRLSVGLNMIYESYDISSKRRRSISNDIDSRKMFVFSKEDVDLELRLG